MSTEDCQYHHELKPIFDGVYNSTALIGFDSYAGKDIRMERMEFGVFLKEIKLLSKRSFVPLGVSNAPRSPGIADFSFEFLAGLGNELYFGA